MTTPKAAPKPVPVRVPPEMVARIDRLRGLVPRETYIREYLLEKALKAEEAKGGKAMTPAAFVAANQDGGE